MGYKLFGGISCQLLCDDSTRGWASVTRRTSWAREHGYSPRAATSPVRAALSTLVRRAPRDSDKLQSTEGQSGDSQAGSLHRDEKDSGVSVTSGEAERWDPIAITLEDELTQGKSYLSAYVATVKREGLTCVQGSLLSIREKCLPGRVMRQCSDLPGRSVTQTPVGAAGIRDWQAAVRGASLP